MHHNAYACIAYTFHGRILFCRNPSLISIMRPDFIKSVIFFQSLVLPSKERISSATPPFSGVPVPGCTPGGSAPTAAHTICRRFATTLLPVSGKFRLSQHFPFPSSFLLHRKNKYDNTIQNLCNSGFRYTESLYASVNPICAHADDRCTASLSAQCIKKKAAAHSHNSFSHFCNRIFFYLIPTVTISKPLTGISPASRLRLQFGTNLFLRILEKYRGFKEASFLIRRTVGSP